MNVSDSAAWRPVIFHASEYDALFITKMLDADGRIEIADTILAQLQELVAARRPDRSLDPGELEVAIAAHLHDRPASAYGNWIYLPWLRQLVHLLPEEEFIEVRTDRNRNKITREEQQRLARARIGIVGLSVGQASAITLAIEGVGRHFRLADFDRLGLSNLNRLRGGVHQLGLNKCVLAARQMFEIDPYLDIEIEPEGIGLRGIDGFLGGRDQHLDLLVEECDEVPIKIMLRSAARERGIPVVMETSDRGLIDIERFDMEPDRPLLHGRLAGLEDAGLDHLTMPEKIALLLRIIGEETLSTRARASMPEVRRTLSTWPQLGSAVALGGAIITDTVRRILLGQLTCSGRFYVDLEQIIGPPSAASG